MELKSKSWALTHIIRRREEYSLDNWLERMEGQSGDIAFTPIAESEKELREVISRDNPNLDLDDIRGEFRKFSEEFIEQSPSYSESPEDSNEEADDDEDQAYHEHDL